MQDGEVTFRTFQLKQTVQIIINNSPRSDVRRSAAGLRYRALPVASCPLVFSPELPECPLQVPTQQETPRIEEEDDTLY